MTLLALVGVSSCRDHFEHTDRGLSSQPPAVEAMMTSKVGSEFKLEICRRTLPNRRAGAFDPRSPSAI